MCYYSKTQPFLNIAVSSFSKQGVRSQLVEFENDGRALFRMIVKESGGQLSLFFI